MNITELKNKIKEATQAVQLTEEEILLCLIHITSSDKQEIINFWYFLNKKLTNDSMNLIRDNCTPFLVKAVYFS